MKSLKLCNAQVLLYGTPILFWQLYWYVGFNQNLVKFSLFLFVPFLLVYLYNDIKLNKGYGKLIRYFIIVFLLSFISAYIVWGQSPLLTYRAGVYSLVVLYYFLLRKYNIKEGLIYRLIDVFSVVYILLWLYALYRAPITVFGNLDDVSDDRGFYRVLQLPSIDVVCLSFFLRLNHIFLDKKRVILNSITAILLLVVIVLSLSRTLIAGIFVALIFYLIYIKRFAFLLSLAILLSASTAVIMQNEVLGGMIEMTTNQFDDKSENDLRMVEYQHALDAYDTDIITFLVGNGDGHVESPLGKKELQLHGSIGFDKSDSGYVGAFCTYGMLGLFILLLICYKALKTKSDTDGLPYKCFILVLLVVNITSYSFFQYGITFMITLYMLEKTHIHKTTQNAEITSN